MTSPSCRRRRHNSAAFRRSQRALGAGPLLTAWVLLGLLVFAVGDIRADEAVADDRPHPPIPVLDWEQRSDWNSVKDAGAVGDGTTDDTAAIQKVLDEAIEASSAGAGRRAVAYFPPGVYRITETLQLARGGNRLHGTLLIGHGRDSRLVWDGPANQPLLVADSVTAAHYEGLVFDGRGSASVGILHPNKSFVTTPRYRHLALLNFTDSGIKVHPNRQNAQAEASYENCYFENCARGVTFLRFNDYNHIFNGCEFVNCGIGIECVNGSFFVLNTHFRGSRSVDIKAQPMHSSAMRRVTSSGSQSFLHYTMAPGAMTIQDAHVDTPARHSGGAVRLAGAPVTLFDCSFRTPAGDSQVIALGRPGQRLILSNNKVEGARGLLGSMWRAEAQVYEAPPGERGALLDSPTQRFIKTAVAVPGKVFDAKRDFGAKADGRTNDAPAIQAAIDAARKHGQGAIAYLPAGQYAVGKTLEITGADYYVGGHHWGTQLRWAGEEGGTVVHVRDARNVTVENMQVAHAPQEKNGIDILQTSAGAGSSVTYDGLRMFGKYQAEPFRKGLHLTGLGSHDQVVLNSVEGNIRVINSADATILGNFTTEGSVVVEGTDTGRDGFLGFATRLATIVTHGLYVRDNHSIVMGDFYHEQSFGMLDLAGSADAPPGRVVVTGGRSHLKNQAGVSSRIDNYHGEIFVGGKEFSDYRSETDPPRQLVHTGEAPVALYLFGNLFWGCPLEIEKQESMRVYQIGNEALTYPNFFTYDARDDYNDEAMKGLSRAFDDLRRLGEMDLKLNHPAVLENAGE